MGWVMFDYGGVICHPQSDEDVAGLAELAGRPRAEFEAAYWAARMDYDRADLDGPAYWQKVAARLGVALSDERIATLILLDTRSWLRLRAETVALIEAASAAGHRLALLSNAPVEVAEAVSALPFAALFDHLAFSCDLRAVKPEPACYHAALERIGAAPGEVVFVDDRPENVAGAAAAGMRGVRFVTADEAREALGRHGVTTG